jgi:hypothetical protein
MPIQHIWNVSIKQPCAPTGTYSLYTTTGSETVPYAVSSGYSLSSANCQCSTAIGETGRTCNWKLYKPKNKGNHQHSWGVVTTHTAQSGLTCNICSTTERISFTDVG